MTSLLTAPVALDLAASPAEAATGCKPTSSQVALFVNRSYAGTCVIFNIGATPNVTLAGLPDNAASSIKVGTSVIAVVHQDVDFGGLDNHSWQSLKKSDTNLGDNKYASLQSAPDNARRVEDSISALWVMRRGCAPGATQVAVFQDTKYGGACTLVGPGVFASAVPVGVPADFVGSLKVGGATRVRVWTGSGFTGSSCTYNAGAGRPTICFGQGKVSALVVGNDTAPPSLGVAHIADGGNGWNVAAPVTLAVDAADSGTGVLGSPTCKDNGTSIPVSGSVPSFSATLSGAGTHAVTCSASDYLGNVASAGDTVKVDTAAPSIGATATTLGAPYTAGAWTNGDVVVAFECTDAGSGVAWVSPPVTVSAEGEAQLATGSCADKAGNSATPTFEPIAIDKSPPSVSGSATVGAEPYPADTWTDQDVTVSFACDDTLSGVASVSEPTVVTSDGQGQSASGSCTDRAGNTATTAWTGIDIDRHDPVLSASATAGGASYQSGAWTNQPVVVGFTCTDAGSGVASVTAPVTVETEGPAQSVDGSCTDNLGRSADATFADIAIDLTPPIVTYTGNAGTYGYGDPIAIGCSASDALSGVADDGCADIVGPSPTLGVGTHTFSASAVDRAGNRATASTTFSITPRPVASVASGSWSDPTIWSNGSVPGPNDGVTVSGGDTVTLDADAAAVAGVTVEAGAALVFVPDLSVTLESSRNVVVEGRFSMRPASAAVTHLLRFVGIDERTFRGGGDVVLESDVGLWVVGAGTLDAVGSPKTSWTRVGAPVAAGATSITLEEPPAGWQPGDEISVAPTEPPTAGTPSWQGFDERRVTGVSGTGVTFDAGTARPHPVVNGAWGAEVMNLTRNVRIEGTPTGRTHVMITATVPQTIENVALRYTGPRQDPDGDGISDIVMGRYALHFHMTHHEAHGSIVEGVVARDGGSHGFVAHMSHGITFRDTIAYNLLDDAYWWDETKITDDTLYDHAIAALLKSIPDFRGYRLAGFVLGRGTGNVTRDSVAVGVQGNKDASGFTWPESANGEPNTWEFTGNVTHNNKVDGIFTWQNTSGLNVVGPFVAYYNGGFGVDHGAYHNNYRYQDGILFENRAGGIRQRALTRTTAATLTFAGMTVIGGPTAVELAEHNLGGSLPVVYRDCAFSGQTGAKIAVVERMNPGRYDFINCDLEPTDFQIVSTLPGMRIRVQRADRTAFMIDDTGTVTPIPRFEPPDIAPTVTLTSPTSDTSFTEPASVTITADAADPDGTISQVELFAGTTSLGVILEGPYTLTWDGVVAGTYEIVAVATDNDGAMTTSAPVTITVDPL